MTESAKSSNGIWFDPQKKRWRARLYHKRRIVHVSYHRTETEAQETLASVREQMFDNHRDAITQAIHASQLHYRTRND